MCDGVEVSPALSTLLYCAQRSSVLVLQAPGSDGIDSGSVGVCNASPTSSAPDDRFVDGVMPRLHHRTKRIDDCVAIIDGSRLARSTMRSSS